MIHRSYTIRFVLHRRSDTARQYLQMRVTPRGGKPVSFATGLSLLPGEWDAGLGRAKGRSPDAAAANTLIAEWSQIVANIFSHYDSLNIVPTAEQLRGAFARATTTDPTATEYVPAPTVQPTLIAAFTQFIADNKAQWSEGTVQTLMAFRKMLCDFKPKTLLSNIDGAWLESFHKWLVEERRQQGVTVHNNLTRLRSFLKWAEKKGMYNGRARQEYQPKVKGAKEKNRAIIYLTHDELQQVEQYQFKERYKNVTKDVFLFCCYTGLRSSDILRLRRADIHGDHITFTTQKTNDTLTIPLNDRAKAILERYRDCQPNRRQRTLGILHPVLPTPDRKTQNKTIHKIMQEIGIDAPTHHTYYIGNERYDEVVPKYQLTSTHTARHTFIVTAISLGIPPTVILSWTGHKNYEAMLPYIAIAGDTSVQQMSKFNLL